MPLPHRPLMGSRKLGRFQFGGSERLARRLRACSCMGGLALPCCAGGSQGQPVLPNLRKEVEKNFAV